MEARAEIEAGRLCPRREARTESGGQGHERKFTQIGHADPVNPEYRGLPLNPSIELDHPHGTGAVDFAECCAVETCGRTAEIDVIQGVERVSANLKLRSLRKPEVAAEVQVRRPTARTAHRAVTEVARPDCNASPGVYRDELENGAESLTQSAVLVSSDRYYWEGVYRFQVGSRDRNRVFVHVLK
jgi:hypothetical protein